MLLKLYNYLFLAIRSNSRAFLQCCVGQGYALQRVFSFQATVSELALGIFIMTGGLKDAVVKDM